MSKVDDELTRRLRRAERPVSGDGLFEGLARRRTHREHVRRMQTGLLAFAVLAATAGGFAFLRQVFDADPRDAGEQLALPANGEIVFSREGPDGRFHLYASQPDGSGVRQITDDATNDMDPAVSPGGETIAYVHELDREIPEEVSEGNPDTPRLSVIATVPIDGGVVSWHTPDELFASDPAWSPDGTQIAFVGQRGTSSHLYVMGVDSLQPEPLTSPLDVQVADPTWSPDGTRIAFALRGPAGPWGLASIHPDGTGLEPLRTPDGDEEAPAWSPDGSRIAFLRTGDGVHEIWTVDPEGGSPRLVARASEATLSDLAWAPDGSALLVSDGEWILRVDPSRPADPDSNLVQLVKGTSPTWQPVPAGSEPEPSSTTEPTSPSAELEGRDIGLGFNLCQLERLGGIDWYGDGTLGSAWTGARTTDGGRCPSNGDGEYVVAADLNGDGIAEPGGMGFRKHCLLCRPFAATDLSGDGVLELIVLEEASSTPSYSIYEVSVPTSERSPGIYALFVAPPGHPEANLPAGAPIRLIVGGDEGFSGGLRCESYPEAPVVVYTWFLGEVDADTDLQGHETRLALGDDGIFHVLDTKDFTIGRDEPTNISTAPACGVDFHPDA